MFESLTLLLWLQAADQAHVRLLGVTQQESKFSTFLIMTKSGFYFCKTCGPVVLL